MYHFREPVLYRLDCSDVALEMRAPNWGAVWQYTEYRLHVGRKCGPQRVAMTRVEDQANNAIHSRSLDDDLAAWLVITCVARAQHAKVAKTVDPSPRATELM